MTVMGFMKVGIVSERLNYPLTGVGRYTYHLIKGLSIHLHDKLYLIDYKCHEPFRDLNKIIIAPWVTHLPKGWKMKSYLWHLYLQFELMKNNFGLDIIHSPENASLFVKLKNQKKIITVHDIIAYKFPKSNTLLTRTRYKLLLPKTLKTADKIISVSNNTKKDLINIFNVPEEKIKVIYPGIDEKFRVLNSNEVSEFQQKYHLKFPYILYVGNLMKHKNVFTLIEAFYKIKKKGIKHKLVIAGTIKVKGQRLFDAIDKLNLRKEVIFTGYVSEEDLPALYNSADLFVYPSLYEGFGFPPLEAMACGTPVITSNTSSLPEVAGNGGIMVDPFDIDGLAKAMYEVLTNEGLREELRKRGLKRTKLFTWENTVKETLSLYKEVASE